MELTCAMLAAYAELAQDGKLSMISGDLDTVHVVGTFPATAGTPLYLVVKLVFPANECGQNYQCRIELIRPDGDILEAPENVITPPAPAPNFTFTKVGFILVFFGITFPSAGEYRIRVLIDGVEIKSLPLRLDAAPAN